MSTGPKIALLEVFVLVARALSAPARLMLLQQLAQAERGVEALADKTGLTVANGAQHPQQLRRAARVTNRRTGKAINYMFEKDGRWQAFTAFLDDGRFCLTNNAAERALRGVALGRNSWLFAGSERGGERAAAMYTPIATATMNDIDPQAWLADVLARLPDIPVSRIHELLPWHWKSRPIAKAA